MKKWRCCCRAKKVEQPAAPANVDIELGSHFSGPSARVEPIEMGSPLKKILGSIGLWGRMSSARW